MRFQLIASTLLALPLLLAAACTSGGTPGTGSSSGTGSGNATGEKDPNEADPEGTTTKPPKQNDGPDGSTDPNDDQDDPSQPPAAGVDGVIEVPLTTATSASADFVLSQSKKTQRIAIQTEDVACPVSLGTEEAPYVYVELKNAGAQRALTSVWISSMTTGPTNTADAMAIYAGTTPPATEAARKGCLGKAVYSCGAAPCSGGWPGLSSAAGDAVEVPANGSVLVFVQGAVTKTGSFKLNVRTDFLQ